VKWLELGLSAIAALWTLSTNLSVRQHYKSSAVPMIPANTVAFVQTLSLLSVLFFHISALHLVWLFPLSYVAAFFALRSKVLGFLPWAYGCLLAYTIPKNW